TVLRSYSRWSRITSSPVSLSYSLYVRTLFFLIPPPPRLSPLFPYTTLFRSLLAAGKAGTTLADDGVIALGQGENEVVATGFLRRSEEHTSELQSRFDLVCRLQLEKKKTSFL